MKKMKGLWPVIATIFIVTAIWAGAYAESKKQDRKISISLTPQEWEVVLQGLSELPMKTSGNVYSSIMQQAQMQLQVQQKPTFKDTTTNKKKP